MKIESFPMPHSDTILCEDDMPAEVSAILDIYSMAGDDMAHDIDFDQKIKLLEEFDDRTQHCYIAIGHASLVAVANAEFNHEKQNVWINGIAVRKHFQQQGIGRRMIEAVETSARYYDLKTASLRTVEGAIGFYEQLGYEKKSEDILPVMIKKLR